jgi:hypothetical protein
MLSARSHHRLSRKHARSPGTRRTASVVEVGMHPRPEVRIGRLGSMAAGPCGSVEETGYIHTALPTIRSSVGVRVRSDVAAASFGSPNARADCTSEAAAPCARSLAVGGRPGHCCASIEEIGGAPRDRRRLMLGSAGRTTVLVIEENFGSAFCARALAHRAHLTLGGAYRLSIEARVASHNLAVEAEAQWWRSIDEGLGRPPRGLTQDRDQGLLRLPRGVERRREIVWRGAAALIGPPYSCLDRADRGASRDGAVTMPSY